MFASNRLRQLPNEAFDVFLSRQKITLSVPPERSILEVVRDAGLDVETSCEDGLCSCCRTRLLGGRPTIGIMYSERKKGGQRIDHDLCLTATDGETLILDL
ncbi:MAG: hypothetical protein Ct9H300mP16_17990 [Pseudomonadota bacterium]|nr:MAG: hypothetical protein Ct9H300mP16_17990 [Pseudomonadota bacterium]